MELAILLFLFKIARFEQNYSSLRQMLSNLNCSFNISILKLDIVLKQWKGNQFLTETLYQLTTLNFNRIANLQEDY